MTSLNAAFALPPSTWTVNRRPRIQHSHAHLFPRRPPVVHKTYCMSTAPPSLASNNVDAPILKSLCKRDVVVTGATGFIGRQLVNTLRHADANVYVLSRDPRHAKQLFAPDGSLPTPTIVQYDAATADLSADVESALATAHVVVNLAGEPVENGRWTTDRKRILCNSRINGTNKLVRHLGAQRSNAVFISASAVGYYGASNSKAFVEDSPPGTDFLAELAVAWEKAALINTQNSRTVVLRLGVVLGNGGGALEKMSTVFKAFLGGVPGGGEQWFSWVHIDDVVRLILHAAVDEKWQGVYNGTAPQPVRLSQFCSELGRALGRPNWLPVPRQAIQAIYGNEAAQLILAGQQVLPKRTRQNGFIYRYKDVASALQQLVRDDKSAKIASK